MCHEYMQGDRERSFNACKREKISRRRTKFDYASKQCIMPDTRTQRLGTFSLTAYSVQ